MNETRRSKAPFWAALGVVAVLGLIAIAYAANKPKVRGVTDVDLRADPTQAKGHFLGDPNAPVEVIEFADFECPACMQFATITEPDVRKMIQAKEISYRYFDFPLDMHRNTWEASNAAACAEEQGKFWEMHDALFENQDSWNGEATSNPKPALKQLAQQVGVDVPKWEQCYDEQRYRPQIAANRAEAERRHISSTPTFIIGNKMLPGALGIDEFKRYVAEAKANGTGRPPVAESKPVGSPPGTTPGATPGRPAPNGATTSNAAGSAGPASGARP